ncbi:MAG: TetR/AcrR family transcriptional repressor of nem operon [Arenicella sp.]|jgi:TetR/AcrR family transcriptional repressor of nem operon
MARLIEFDRGRALESAMLLFWKQGYNATSLSQLLEAMAISRSSFYAAFIDKRSVYIEALTLFSQRTNSVLLSVEDDDNPANAIKHFFEHTLFTVPERRMRRGCMMVNTVLELADVDQGLSILASQKLDEIEQAFEMCFDRALESKTFSSQQTAKELAQFVMTINQGLRVASRKESSKKDLQNILKTTTAVLGLAA